MRVTLEYGDNEHVYSERVVDMTWEQLRELIENGQRDDEEGYVMSITLYPKN